MAKRLRANYYFGQCLDYTVAADHVAYEEDAAKAAALLRSNEPYAVGMNSSACFVPRPWSNFYSTWSQSGLLPRGSLFLHERRSRGGGRRLVAVDFQRAQGWAGDQLTAIVRVFEPSAGFSWARLLTNSAQNLSSEPLEWKRLRIFSGQPDGGDESHFTIGYLADGKAGTIDGWLRADDSVVLEVHSDAPTTQARPSPGWSP
jgi:hypothetical protein